MNSYSMIEKGGKYIVRKASPDGMSYLMSVQGSGSVWWFEPSKARAYSRKTALWHLRNFRASDPDCEEDY